MFWPDVIALKEFYATALGQFSCNAIWRQVHAFWPETRDEVMLGIGFATPYIQGYVEQSQRVIACMPAQQGVIHWPLQGRNLSLLSDEAELPLPDNSVHKVLVVHAIENSEHVRGMLSEVWRVLAPGGRILVVAPNRRGIWARAPGSPFAFGQPYSVSQLCEVLSEHSFTPLKHAHALFFPPSGKRYVLRMARLMESVGRRFFPAFGGVLLQEAEKRIYAPIVQKAYRGARRVYVTSAQPVRSAKTSGL